MYGLDGSYVVFRKRVSVGMFLGAFCKSVTTRPTRTSPSRARSDALARKAISNGESAEVAPAIPRTAERRLGRLSCTLGPARAGRSIDAGRRNHRPGVGGFPPNRNQAREPYSGRTLHCLAIWTNPDPLARGRRRHSPERPPGAELIRSTLRGYAVTALTVSVLPAMLKPIFSRKALISPSGMASRTATPPRRFTSLAMS
jgi:hypothetical protein